jgi:hypothetical protein
MSVTIQYLGFQLKPRGRDYTYRVVDPKAQTREFTLTISYQAFMERRVPYQDAPGLCYQKLQRDLATETPERPLQQHSTVSDQELAEFREKHHSGKRRGA